MEKVIQVLIVEDHDIMRFGLEQLLGSVPGLRIGAALGSGNAALSYLREHLVDVVVLDLSLPDCHGLNLIGTIRKRQPNVGVVVLSMHDELNYGERALAAGAAGYLSKNARPDVLIDAVIRIARGGMYVSEALQERLLNARVRRRDTNSLSPLDLLSDREVEILEMLGRGKSTSQIADDIRRSVKTVDAHRENIKRKLALRNSTELIRYAVCWVEQETVG